MRNGASSGGSRSIRAYCQKVGSLLLFYKHVIPAVFVLALV